MKKIVSFKTLSLLLLTYHLVFLSLNSFGVSFSVIGPCSSKPVHSGDFKTDLSDNLGKISMDIFDFYKISYIGAEEGMNSIIDTPTGEEAIEVLSDTKMRAYGWCYSVNNKIPDVLPKYYFFKSQKDHLVWFYAYSTYDNGQWTDYCVPSYKIKSKQFCK